MRMPFLIIGLSILIGCSTNKVDSKPYNNQTSRMLEVSEVILSAPMVTIDSMFFHEDAELSLEFRQDGSSIMYKEDSGESIDYIAPVEITKSTKVSAVVNHSEYLSSEPIEIQFVKLNNYIANAKVSLSTNPHEDYPALGIESLIDHKKGSLDFRSNNRWCGFNDKEVTLTIHIAEAIILESIYVSTLTDINSWIFNPETIQVIINDSVPLDPIHFPILQNPKPKLNVIPITFSPQKVSSLEIVIESLDSIPSWHPGAGHNPWLFIDEIIVE